MGRSVLMCPEWEYMGKKVDNSGFTTVQTLQNSTSLYFLSHVLLRNTQF